MARRLRIQFPGAIYHVINRGNYRRDVFETAGAAKAFEATLDEACQGFRWRLHGYVIMRNHFHLALETIEPNLVEGMHWLQSTFATRFNRLRSERGHLFQGRYQSLLVENASALAKLVNYIHLNPVRAHIVPAAQVAMFRWSSLARFLKRDRSPCLVAAEWLGSLGWDDSASGWASYVADLIELAGEPERQQEEGWSEMSRGWAIGTNGWRKVIAKEHVQVEINRGFDAAEIGELKTARWERVLDATLLGLGKSITDAANDGKCIEWKLAAAAVLRREARVPHVWIAQKLNMGSPHSLRSYLSRRTSRINQQTSA